MKHLALALTILGAAPTLAFAQDDPNAPGGQTATPTIPPPGGAANQMASTGAGPEIFKHGTMGLSFEAFSITPDVNLDFLYFADASTAYDLIGGLHYAHTAATTMGMPPVTVPGGDILGVTVGLGYRMYQHHSARIHTFLEPAVVIGDADISNNFGSSFSLAISGVLGAEAMLTEWFSISGTIGVGLEFANKFDTITLATAQSGLFANFYWN